MATKKALVVVDSPSGSSKKFSFSDSFNKSFDALIDVYADSLTALNKAATGKALKSEYGVCSCTYKLRYVTPNDVSTYVSNLIKGLEKGIFHDRIADVELFTVASVKRFIEDNKCPAFETSAVLDDAHNYVNPKECTLQDLAHICENDIGEVALYSRGEMVKRIEYAKDDIKKLNDIHFAANMKKIIKALPDVLQKSGTMIIENSSYRLTFGTFLEEFLLFVCTLNIIAVLQLIGYIKPSVDYTVKKKDENSEDLVTECCLVNTTTYMVRNRLPFNCNMRDIALQDVTPDFKDTHDAMHFIMKDPRSPIGFLVGKYADENVSPYDSSFIAKMFVGMNHDFDHGEYYKRNADRADATPRENDCFETNVDWLDTIAFGNNYLDGNYRRDAMGNNRVHPITNALDMLYRVYGGCDLKTNKDLANNLIRVAGAMKSIISNYNDGNPIENYDITKDILVLLGEIMTRNMLRLYYNNTRVFTYDDNMPDAAAPGFVCMESFIMEADAPANNNNPNNPNNPNNKSGVTFTNSQGQPLNGNNNKQQGVISNTINKLIDWIKNQLSKFAGNFEKKYKQYIDEVTKNDQINKGVSKAIAEGTFVPNLTNVPMYGIDTKDASRFTKGISKNDVLNLLNPSNEFNATNESFRLLGIDNNTAAAIQKNANTATATTNDPKKAATQLTDAIVNYFLTGRAEPVKNYSGKMEQKEWDKLVNDLKNCTEFVKKASEGLSKTVAEAGQAVKEKMAEAQQSNNDALKKRCDEVSKMIETVSSIYDRQILVSIGSKFFASRYSLYRDIIIGYKQQNNTQQQPAATNTTNNANTTNTANNTNAAPAQAPANNGGPAPMNA